MPVKKSLPATFEQLLDQAADEIEASLSTNPSTSFSVLYGARPARTQPSSPSPTFSESVEA